MGYFDACLHCIMQWLPPFAIRRSPFAVCVPAFRLLRLKEGGFIAVFICLTRRSVGHSSLEACSAPGPLCSGLGKGMSGDGTKYMPGMWPMAPMAPMAPMWGPAGTPGGN